MKTIAWTLCVTAIISFSRPLPAATISAPSPSQPDVQAAIDSAADGDTVLVPRGSATWPKSVVLADKSLTLQGAGPKETVITNATNAAIHVKGGKGKPFRITGLGFDGAGNTSGRSILLTSGSYIGFRIDHCRFDNERHMLDIRDVRAEGLVDHCQYACLENKGGGDHTAIYAFGDATAAWKRPPGLGTRAAVYVEDCEFDYFAKGNSDRPFVAMGNGAKLVFRHNKATNGCFESFGATSYYTGARGAISLEVYDNQFSGNCYCLFTIKGGTATIFNNTVTGYPKDCFELTNYRTLNYAVSVPYGPGDGMHAIDGNAPIEAGRHTAGNGQPVLTCAGRQWTANQWVGYAVWNETGDSVGRITANTADTITTAAGLVEGCTIADSGTVSAVRGNQMTCAGKHWQYTGLTEFCYVYNVTDGSFGRINANTPDALTATLAGGARNSWQVGDSFQVTQRPPHAGVRKNWNTDDAFKIVNGAPCFDQIGRVQDADAQHIQPQVSAPLYTWNNTVDGKPLNPRVNRGGTSPCSVADHIQPGRDYFTDTPPRLQTVRLPPSAGHQQPARPLILIPGHPARNV